MKIMFYGEEERRYPEGVVQRLNDYLRYLQGKQVEFLYCGRNRFELLAAIGVKKLECTLPAVRTLVAGYPKQVWDELLYDRMLLPCAPLDLSCYRDEDGEIKLPQEVEQALTAECTEWALKQADVLVCYVSDPEGNAARIRMLAEKMKKSIILL